MKIKKAELFKRQITLSEIGEVGQQKLQDASVLVVGCGGLGSPIAVYLASSGLGKIHLVDFDTVDSTNLHRQVFFSLDDVGKSKSAVLSEFIKKRAPFTTVTCSNFPIRKENVFDLIAEVDIVIDGTDSLPTKYLLNDACVLQNKPLIYGSLYKFDGYVSSFNVLQKDGSYSANLRDAFPKMATDIPNCEEAGTLNSIVGLIATQQVNEVLKLITGIGKPLANELLIYNILQNSQLKMKLKASVSKTAIKAIFESENYFDASCEIRNNDWLITANELKSELADESQTKPILFSVIANKNMEYPFKIDVNIPLSELENSDFQPKLHQKYVVVCLKGNSSYTATKILKEKFPAANIFSLTGGITAY